MNTKTVVAIVAVSLALLVAASMYLFPTVFFESAKAKAYALQLAKEKGFGDYEVKAEHSQGGGQYSFVFMPKQTQWAITMVVLIDGREKRLVHMSARSTAASPPSPVIAQAPTQPSGVIVRRSTALPRFEAISTASASEPDSSVAIAPVTAEKAAGLRNWTSANGKFSLRARLVSSSGGYVTLIDERGKERKVVLEKLSAADRDFVREQNR